ncbi:MAG: hypothetical protein V3U11_14580 [Planctomycetota bacterium]
MLGVLQKVLVDCCLADDPVATFAAARKEHPELSPWLEHVDPEGLQLTSLLVKKLRFERILGGDPNLREQFQKDPQTFTIRFREYLAAVPPTAVFPQEEAESFRKFLARPGETAGSQ